MAGQNNSIGLARFGFGKTGIDAGSNCSSNFKPDVFKSNQSLFSGKNNIYKNSTFATPNSNKNYTVINSINNSFVRIPKGNLGSQQIFSTNNGYRACDVNLSGNNQFLA